MVLDDKSSLTGAKLQRGDLVHNNHLIALSGRMSGRKELQVHRAESTRVAVVASALGEFPTHPARNVV